MSKPAKIFLFLVLFTGLFGTGKSYGETVLSDYQRIADTVCCNEKSKLQTPPVLFRKAHNK